MCGCQARYGRDSQFVSHLPDSPRVRRQLIHLAFSGGFKTGAKGFQRHIWHCVRVTSRKYFGFSWRVRLAKQETLTPPGHLVSPLVFRGP